MLIKTVVLCVIVVVVGFLIQLIVFVSLSLPRCPMGAGRLPPILSDRDDFGIFFGSLIEVGINLGKVIFAKICLLWGREGAKNSSFHTRSLFIVTSYCYDLFLVAARISFPPCSFVSTATSHCSPSPESLS